VFRDQLHCLPIKETATHNHQPVCTQGHPRPKIPSGHHLFPERKTLAFRRRYLRKPHSNSRRGLRSDSPATSAKCISHDSRSPGQNLNPGYPEYKAVWKRSSRFRYSVGGTVDILEMHETRQSVLEFNSGEHRNVQSIMLSAAASAVRARAMSV
jgi:hypothetical protein